MCGYPPSSNGYVVCLSSWAQRRFTRERTWPRLANTCLLSLICVDYRYHPCKSVMVHEYQLNSQGKRFFMYLIVLINAYSRKIMDWESELVVLKQNGTNKYWRCGYKRHWKVEIVNSDHRAQCACYCTHFLNKKQTLILLNGKAKKQIISGFND